MPDVFDTTHRAASVHDDRSLPQRAPNLPSSSLDIHFVPSTAQIQARTWRKRYENISFRLWHALRPKARRRDRSTRQEGKRRKDPKTEPHAITCGNTRSVCGCCFLTPKSVNSNHRDDRAPSPTPNHHTRSPSPRTPWPRPPRPPRRAARPSTRPPSGRSRSSPPARPRSPASPPSLPSPI